MEDSLQISKRTLADIIDFLPDATLVVDLEGKVVAWNKAIEKMTGVKKEQMIGQGDHAYSIPFYGTRRGQLMDLLTLNDEQIKKNYDYVTREGETLYAETFCSALNGGKGAYVWASASSIFNDKGARIGAIESIRDITERKRVEAALKESVQRYELVMDGSSAGLWDSDLANKRIHFSPHWKAMRGYTDAEIGDSETEWISRIHPDDAPRIIAAIQAHFNGQTDVYEAEYRVRRKDGSYIWVLDRGKAVRDESGKVIRNVGSEIDITERKRAEAELSSSQQLIEGIINSIPVRVFWKDRNLVFLGCNTVFARDAGFADSKDVVGKDDFQMVWHDQAELYQGDDRQVIESGNSKFFIEEPQKTPSGDIITLLTSKIPLRSSEGKIIGVLGTYIDITERRRAEDALRESEAKIRTYFDNSPEGIFIVDAKGNYVDVNSTACSMLGYSREELLALNIMEVTEESVRQDALKGFQKLAAERAMAMETVLLKKDGAVVPIFLNAVGLPGERYMAFCTDISERRRAGAALKESVQRYELVMEGSSAGLWDWDVPGHRIHFSPRWKAMRGYTDTEIGEGEMEWSSRLHPEDEMRVMGALQAHFEGLTDVYEEEYRIICKDGSIKWILDRGKAVRDSNGRVIRAAGSEIDITERKKMDLQIKERIKELGAFYSLAEMAERDGLTLKQLYQEITNVLPNSWRYPESAYARVVIKDSEFRTENFKESPWKQLALVKFNGTIIGKVEVGYLEERPELDEGPFLKEERQLIEAIAERIGHITGRTWVEEELQRSNAKLGILNNITRHDINNQMMVINGFLDLCKLREKDPNLARYFDKMSLAATNIHEQINFTKDYQELGIKAPAWSSVGRRVRDAFAMLHPQGVVLEDQTEGIEVLTDPMADKVHYNLIDNSMRHGGNVTRIKVHAERAGDAMMIIYEDDGVGISEEDKKRLFQKGFGNNTGFGLFLIREILAITGITINETGSPGKGARFEMTVPPGAWRLAPGLAT